MEGQRPAEAILNAGGTILTTMAGIACVAHAILLAWARNLEPAGFSRDGGPALSAQLDQPAGVCVSPMEACCCRLRKTSGPGESTRAIHLRYLWRRGLRWRTEVSPQPATPKATRVTG